MSVLEGIVTGRCSCLYLQNPGPLWDLLPLVSTLPLKTGSLTKSECHNWLDWLASKPQEPSCLCFSSTAIKGHTEVGASPGHYACAASPSEAESFPWTSSYSPESWWHFSKLLNNDWLCHPADVATGITPLQRSNRNCAGPDLRGLLIKFGLWRGNE